MGNESRMRTRDDAAYGQRSAGVRPSADDPLAELARLIGQEDPFAEFFRENGEPASQAPAARTARPAAAPAPRAPHADPLRQDAPRHEPVRQEARPEPARHEQPRHEAVRPGQGSFSALAAEVYAEPIPRQGDGRGRGEPREPQVPPRQETVRNEPVRAASRPVREAETPRAAERAPSVSSRAASDRAAEAVAEALFATPPAQPAPAQPARAPAARPQPAATPARAAAPAPAFGAPTARAEAPQPRGGYTLDDDAYDYGRTAVERDNYDDDGPEELDDGYEAYQYEEERPPRSRRLALLGTAIGCAILLIAGGYFGLRAMSGGGGSALVASGQPPVIKADHGPNKVAPPQTANDQSADGQKLIYDRVGGDPSGNEKVVSSQEEPVDPSQAAQPQAPRVILPPTGGSPAPSPSAPAPLGAMPSANPPQPQPSAGSGNPTEPKRVRTLTVRADGTVVDGSSAPAIPAPAAPMAPSPSAQAAAQLGSPMQVSSYAQDDTQSSSPMPANVPLPPTRVAAAPPVASPAPAAPAPAAADGGYFVQIAAQRTQGEAQSAWKATQSKYPGILGSYSANIRRADLGDRGIYYRAQVGPFNSKDQANELCQSLRAQGGDCMVQRN